MQPPPAIKPCNPEASEDKLRLPKLFHGEPKGPRLVCGNPSPKYASIGWDFSSSCSVGVLWLSWGSIFVSSAVSLSVSARLLMGAHHLFLPLRSLLEFSFPTFRQQRIFHQTICSCWLTAYQQDCIYIATQWLGSNKAPGLLSKISTPEPHDGHFLA